MTLESGLALPATAELIVEHRGSVVTIWLNRPEVRNALSAKMAQELAAVFAALRDERRIRTIVLRGKGGVFCAGGDIKGFKTSLQGDARHVDVMRASRSFGDLMSTVNEQPQVVVVLVEGAAIGGGLGLACVGDVTIVTKAARFRLSETSLGIPPAQIAPFVTDRVGLTAARRLMLTGARFSGDDAVAMGIGHIVVDDSAELERECAQVLEQIQQCAPGANAATKAIIFESMRRPRTDALDFAANSFADCMLSDEGREGVAAFVAKRRPAWSDDVE